MLRKLRIMSMRGYEKRMKQISDDPDFPLTEFEMGTVKTLTPRQYAMLQKYGKLQKQYLELAEINRKEYERKNR